MSATDPSRVTGPTSDTLAERHAARGSGARSSPFVAGALELGWVSLACVAPIDAAPPDARPGTRAFWILTEETGRVVVEAVGAPLDGLAGAVTLE